MIDREKWQKRVSHHTVLNEKNLTKALPRYFSEPSATLSIILLHCICLSSPSYESKSILGDFNWAASYPSFACAYNCGHGFGMENRNGSIFCTEMEPNMNKKSSERIFDIPYIT